MASLPRSPSGTLRLSISEILPPMESRSSTPSARHIRRIEPKRLMATGWTLRPPFSRITCSKRSAGPPPGLFMHRSAISATSRRARTGWGTRTSSPRRSISLRNSRRLSMGMEVRIGVAGVDDQGVVTSACERSSPLSPPERSEGGTTRGMAPSLRSGGLLGRLAGESPIRPRPHVQRAHAAQEQLVRHVPKPLHQQPARQLGRLREGERGRW